MSKPAGSKAGCDANPAFSRKSMMDSWPRRDSAVPLANSTARLLYDGHITAEGPRGRGAFATTLHLFHLHIDVPEIPIIRRSGTALSPFSDRQPQAE